MQYLDDIVGYFKYLCEVHPDLLHADAPGHRVFEVRPLEEAVSDVRTGAKEKDYLVRLVLPTLRLGDNAANAVKTYEVGLLVAKWHGSREALKDDIVVAMADAEMVADEILGRMIADSRNGHPLFFGRADRAEALGFSGEFLHQIADGSYSGVLYIFSMATFRCIPATVAWTDGGLTSY